MILQGNCPACKVKGTLYIDTLGECFCHNCHVCFLYGQYKPCSTKPKPKEKQKPNKR